VDRGKLRAYRAHKQGLIGEPFANLSPAEILDQTGWVRGVGSAAPYQHFATRANFRREQIDKAVANLEIHELPAVRGCTYIVPASDFALALRFSQANDVFAPTSPERALGVTKEELQSLAESTLKALTSGPLQISDIKKELGGQVRSFGEEGKKRGISTDLPGVINRLQTTGQIRRIPTNGRLDQEKYIYTLWEDNPLHGVQPSPEELHAELADQYFRWVGPATIDEFRWFTSLPAGKSKLAFENAGLIAIDDQYYASPEDADNFASFKTLSEPDIKILASLDNLVLLAKCLYDIVDESDYTKSFDGVNLGSTKGFGDPTCHMITDRGRLIGYWLYNPESEQIVYKSWAGDANLIENAILKTQNRIKEELGDFRSFSLDSPKSRLGRIQLLSDGKPIQ